MKEQEEPQYSSGAKDLANEMFYGGDVREKEADLELAGGGVAGGVVPEFHFGPGSEGFDMYLELRDYVMEGVVDDQAAGATYGQALEAVEDMLEAEGFNSDYELDVQSPSGRKQVENGDLRALVGSALREAEENASDEGFDYSNPLHRMAHSVDVKAAKNVSDQEVEDIAQLLR